MATNFLRKLSLWSDLEHDDWNSLAALCSNCREIPKKRYISRDGDRLEKFPIVVNGWAARYQILRNGSRQITSLLLPGDFCYFDAAPSGASFEEIVAISRCTVAYVSHTAFENTMCHRPRVALAVQRYGRFETSILSSWIVNVGRRDALERMAHLICEAKKRLEQVGLARGDSFHFPLTQEDLADILGLTPVHTNRKLQQLRQERVISLQSKELTILDQSRLERIAGFDASYLSPVMAPPNVFPVEHMAAA
ncbi:MAG TPA: Crp/Fnr family transcriptional regulator [Novosphingobium sp.]|nr:Crp/Fnr family transcriptional regulator [Novosphingobium sp.]